MVKDLITQLEGKVSSTESRCAELEMEVDELKAHVKASIHANNVPYSLSQGCSSRHKN